MYKDNTQRNHIVLLGSLLLAVLLFCSACSGEKSQEEAPKEPPQEELTERQIEILETRGWSTDLNELSEVEYDEMLSVEQQLLYLDNKYGVHHKPIYREWSANTSGEFLFYGEDESEIIISVWTDLGHVFDDYLAMKLDYVMSRYLTDEFLNKCQLTQELEYKACRLNGARYEDEDFDIDHLLGKEEGINLIHLYFSSSEVSKNKAYSIAQEFIDWIENNTGWEKFYFKIFVEGDLFFSLNDIDTIWPYEILDNETAANRSYQYIISVWKKDGEITMETQEK